MKYAIDHFGLKFCLKKPLSKLRDLVNEGLYDPKTNRKIAIRIICCLGMDNEYSNTTQNPKIIMRLLDLRSLKLDILNFKFQFPY